MSKVSDLHNKAMEFADRADMERRQSNEKRAAEFFEQALEFELAAIAELCDQDGLTWSVLHRSAGWLALDCNRPRLGRATGLQSPRWRSSSRDCRGIARSSGRNLYADAPQIKGHCCGRDR